jgi:hypothetical protein
MWLTSNQRSQQQVLRAWRATAHKQASAKRLLRRLLLNTLAGAFVEWRMLAQEGAHWKKVGGACLSAAIVRAGITVLLWMPQATCTSYRTQPTTPPSNAQVQQQLGEVLTLEHPRVRQNCLAAIQRWSHWPLSAAFSSWQAAVVVQRQEREVAVRALKFRLVWVLEENSHGSWQCPAWQHIMRSSANSLCAETSASPYLCPTPRLTVPPCPLHPLAPPHAPLTDPTHPAHTPHSHLARYYTTALKVFTGLRLAVVSGRLRAAAAAKGRRSILRRHLRAWQDGAWQQQVGMRALTAWSWTCLSV